MKPLIIIKLGGSIITHKNSSTPKPRNGNIRRLAKEVATLFKTRDCRIILVHGAGSFGHPIVKKNNLHRGMKTARQKLAYAQTTQNMLDLDELIVKSLTAKSVPAVTLPPHSFVTQRAGKIKSFNHEIISKYLEKRQVPVLFGDAVLDEIWGCSILSGDTIVSYLAQKLKARKVVFLSDVDGIFDQDPKTYPEAKLIKQVNDKNLKEVLAKLVSDDSSSVNVTGEMYGKIMAIKENLRGVKTIITNGFKKNALTKAIDDSGDGSKLNFDLQTNTSPEGFY